MEKDIEKLMEDGRIRQLEINCKYLREAINQIAKIVCPDFIGTWQQTTEHVVNVIKSRNSGDGMK